jgi:hypothetical protein
MTASRRMGLLAGLLLGTSAALGAEGIAGQGQVAPAKGDLTRPVAREAATADQAPALAKSAATIGQTSIVKTGAARAAQPRTSPPPANDDCFNAYVFDLYPGSPVTFQDDNTGATTDCPALAPYGDAWYKFTTYETLEVVIKYCGTTPAFWNANIAFDPTCPCSGAWLFASAWDNSSCGDGNWSLYWHNLPAGTYYWPLLTDSAGGYAEGPYTLTFEATVPPPGPECPTEALFGQGPPGPTGNGIPFLSAITSSFNYKVYDNFYSVPDQIGDLHWWGFSLSYDENWYPCDPSELTFEIAFYVDNGGAPGTVVNTYLMTPTVVDTGLTYGTYPLYDFSVGSLLPCAVTHTGWLSIQSQSNPADCAFAWICTDAGDTLGWYEYDGSLFATHLSFAFCLLGGDCPPIYGACCDDYTGVCDDNVDWSDCLPPLRFTPGTLCAELSPSCGIVGACCDAGLNCVFTGLEADCDAIDGGFYPGQTCPEFACPDECQHRIDLYDCFGDGWNGNKLDVLVNGVTILSQITLPSGLGPLPFYFTAATGDTIQTIYYPIGGWPYEPYYMIYGGLGFLLGQDGGNCQQPTGITVYGNCAPPTTGACCYFTGGCDMVGGPDQCIDGEFLGLGHACSECPCYVPCPPGAIPEPEPCGEDTDGGCGMEVPTFAPISCGDTMCGTIWATTEEHDTDWYEIVTTDWNYFTWTAECEVPVLIVVLRAGPGGGCADFTILGSATAGACEPATFTTDAVPADKYWFWVGSSDWGDWPCEQHYTAMLTCEPTGPHYCSGSGGCDEYISRVQIGAIDNATVCTHYGDYTSLSTELYYGIETPLVVTNGNPIWTADTCSVWIDWNHDLVFDDTTEALGDLPGVGPYHFTITPPATALFGPTRMRISIDYANSNPDPCGDTQYGEVEDYTVNVLDPSGACCWPGGSCTIETASACGGDFGGADTECANEDCDSNGVDDFCDILYLTLPDCNHNGIPDPCEEGYELDCNDNGVADFCDIADGTSQDCNSNGIPDECDVASGFSQDCQADGIPDECQIAEGGPAHTYQHDDGDHEDSIGLPDIGGVIWMNHFVVAPNASMLRKIYVAYGQVANGTVVAVMVWSDPNQDGDPTDAQVLVCADAWVANADLDLFNVVNIPPTYIGPAGTHFFVGVLTYYDAGERPCSLDTNASAGQSWICGSTSGSIDPNNMGAAELPPTVIDSFGPAGNWLIRAKTLGSADCNHNQIPDECDIGEQWGGYCTGPNCSSDWNHNGVPDECELCGDLDNDGDVDLDDYWVFLAAYGACAGDPNYNAVADLDGDGCVTLVDYQAWRLCYKMANGKDFVAPKPQPMPAPAPKAPQGGAT